MWGLEYCGYMGGGVLRIKGVIDYDYYICGSIEGTGSFNLQFFVCHNV